MHALKPCSYIRTSIKPLFKLATFVINVSLFLGHKNIVILKTSASVMMPRET